MNADHVDALVIFGATGDLAKLETFPALVGLVERGVLDVPVLGVARSGWELPQFREYAAASLKLNNMDAAGHGRSRLASRRPRRRQRRPRGALRPWFLGSRLVRTAARRRDLVQPFGVGASLTSLSGAG